MYTKELTSLEIPKLAKTDTVKKALEIIERNRLTHVPVLENDYLLGCLSEECLLNMKKSETLDKAKNHLERLFLSTKHLLLDTFKIYHTFDANIIAIIDKDEKYQGTLHMEDVVYYLSRYPFISEIGAVLIVETTLASYSMTEIAKIVESNNTKLFGAIITHADQEIIQITLKISTDNLSSIDETFQRFGYRIHKKFYEDNKDEFLKDRYSQFIKYLEL